MLGAGVFRQLSHIYTPGKKEKNEEEGHDFVCSSAAATFSHHMVIPRLGMVRQLNVPPLPPTLPTPSLPPHPNKPTHIPPLLIISKSRAAYARNIRLLCVVINPITHMDKCTAPRCR